MRIQRIGGATGVAVVSGGSIVSDASGMRDALEASRAGFVIERIPAQEALPDWSLTDGALQHRSRGFFSVCGARDSSGERIVLYQPQGAINGMLTRRVDGERQFLFQARAEPGNVGQVQFGPTLQSTPANYLRFHGGETSTYFSAFLQQTWDAMPRSETTQLDLGSIYHQKTKRVIFADTDAETDAAASFFWLTPAALGWGVHNDFVMNTDARALIAVSRWSADPDVGELAPSSAAVRRSLAAPVRPEVIGEAMRQLAAPVSREGTLVRLESLVNWVFDDDGLREVEGRQNVSVGFYAVAARFREVRRWVQPLMTASSRGDSVLLAREHGGEVEVLVAVRAEPGLVTGRALAPTWQRYPGDLTPPPDWLVPHLDDVWCETTESDEGGRFIDHVSRFAVVRLGEGGTPPAEAGVWMRVSELKTFLEASNHCTIQLRVVASHLLGLD